MPVSLLSLPLELLRVIFEDVYYDYALHDFLPFSTTTHTKEMRRKVNDTRIGLLFLCKALYDACHKIVLKYIVLQIDHNVPWVTREVERPGQLGEALDASLKYMSYKITRESHKAQWCRPLQPSEFLSPPSHSNIQLLSLIHSDDGLDRSTSSRGRDDQVREGGNMIFIAFAILEAIQAFPNLQQIFVIYFFNKDATRVSYSVGGRDGLVNILRHVLFASIHKAISSANSDEDSYLRCRGKYMLKWFNDEWISKVPHSRICPYFRPGNQNITHGWKSSHTSYFDIGHSKPFGRKNSETKPQREIRVWFGKAQEAKGYIATQLPPPATVN